MWECDLFDGGCVNRFLRRWSEGVFFWQGWKPSTAIQRMETYTTQSLVQQRWLLETKYRDIADGNTGQLQLIVRSFLAGWKPSTAIQRMETCMSFQLELTSHLGWKPSTAIQRIQNRSIDGIEPLYWVVTKRCVYYKRLVLYIVHTPTKQIPTRTQTKPLIFTQGACATFS